MEIIAVVVTGRTVVAVDVRFSTLVDKIRDVEVVGIVRTVVEVVEAVANTV